jgi:hypothetical protein
MVSVPLTDTINVLPTDTTNAFCSSGGRYQGSGMSTSRSSVQRQRRRPGQHEVTPPLCRVPVTMMLKKRVSVLGF